MDYATADDLRARYGAREIDQLDTAFGGRQRVALALLDATAEIDAALYPYYGPLRATPAPPPPEPIPDGPVTKDLLARDAGMRIYAASTEYDSDAARMTINIHALDGADVPTPSVVLAFLPWEIDRGAEDIETAGLGVPAGQLRRYAGMPAKARDLTPRSLHVMLFGVDGDLHFADPLVPRPQDFSLVCVPSYDDDVLTQAEADAGGPDGPTSSMTAAVPFPEYNLDPRADVYLFLGVPQDAPDLQDATYGETRGFSVGASIRRRDEHDPVVYDGRAYKWWSARRNRQQTNLGYSWYVDYAPYS